MVDGESPGSRSVPVSRFKKVIFSCVVVVGLLALLEATCRLVGLGEMPAVHQDISNWDRQWKSDFYVFDPSRVDPRFGINRDGLRDHEHEVEVAEGTLRVVCLGDSVTYGYGVAVDQSYPSHLRAELNQRASVEVFNVALPGWSTRQQRIAYENIVRRYHPDYVILGVCLNDIPEMQNNLAPPPRLIGLLYQYSHFVRLLLPSQQREIGQVSELWAAPDSPRVRQAWELAFDEIRALARMVKDDGARFGLILFPFRRQVLGNPPPPLPQETFRRFCEDEHIRFWDGRQALQKLGTHGFVDYDHLSSTGGSAIATQIIQSNWIEVGPAGEERNPVAPVDSTTP